MVRTNRIIAVFGLLALAGLAWAAPGPPANVSDVLAERVRGGGPDKIDVIVTFRTPPGHLERSEVARLGGRVKHEFESIPGIALSLPAKAVEQLARRPNVEWVTLDMPVQLHGKPSKDGGGDPGGTDGGGSPADSHSDLDSRVKHAVNFVANDNFTGDKWGHGTHVAGIIAGSGASSKRALYQGLAPGAEIVDVRVLEQAGSGFTSDVIAGVDWVIANKDAHGIRVLNMSLGHTIVESVATDPLVLAVEQAWEAGIVVVVSAGNLGRDGYSTITSPGNSPRVITVGSMTDYGNKDKSDDIVSTYSSRGPTLGDHYVKPDLLATGNKVVSLRSPGSALDLALPENRVDSAYFMLSGTSMAAPKVAATVALMLEQDPSLPPDTVKARLMRSAYKPTIGDVFSTGAGLLNIAGALADTGWTDYAASPKALPDEATGTMTFENTGVLWGAEEWSQAYMWSDTVLGEIAIWGD
jgi:serine protease AprX